jgi:predicted esterase
MTNFDHVHADQPVLSAGVALGEARAAAILIHGRGAGAYDILGLSRDLPHPDYIYLAPQAKDSVWYPNRFLMPVALNEPYLSSALMVIDELREMINDSGVPDSRIVLIGFSQGACLALEYAARAGLRLGGVAGLSGGLIGEVIDTRRYKPLVGTPVFLGCSDVDFHIPLARVEESAEVIGQLGGVVTKRIYPRMGHLINDDEIMFVRTMLDAAALAE